ncbi:MAG: HAD family hydrolase [Oscillospiraceae bacterium]
MKRWDGVLLACDFDNTIAPTQKCISRGLPFPGVPEENLTAIRRFMAEGGRFAVVTGRAYPAFLHLRQLVPTNCPTALFNGAGVYDFEQGKYLWRLELPAEILQHCREVMEAFPRLGFEVFLWDERVFAVRPNAFIERHQRLTGAPWKEIGSLEELGEPVAKLLFEDEYEVLLQVQRFLRSRPWIGAYETIFSGKNLLELTAKGADKAGAVRFLAKYLSIAPEHIYCAGDEENDLPMLQMAAEAFVPEDGNPLLRDRGFHFVGPCTRHAVADMVAALEEKYPAGR